VNRIGGCETETSESSISVQPVQAPSVSSCSRRDLSSSDSQPARQMTMGCIEQFLRWCLHAVLNQTKGVEWTLLVNRNPFLDRFPFHPSSLVKPGLSCSGINLKQNSVLGCRTVTTDKFNDSGHELVSSNRIIGANCRGCADHEGGEDYRQHFVFHLGQWSHTAHYDSFPIQLKAESGLEYLPPNQAEGRRYHVSSSRRSLFPLA